MDVCSACPKLVVLNNLGTEYRGIITAQVSRFMQDDSSVSEVRNRNVINASK